LDTSIISGIMGMRSGLSRAVAAAGMCVLMTTGVLAQVAAREGGFHAFIATLWPDAQARGVTRATFDKALGTLEPDLALPDLIKPGETRPAGPGQAEFTKTPAQYLDEAMLRRLTQQGRALRVQHATTLAKIERDLGVDRNIVLAIWGRETAFGGYKPATPVFRALATQAWMGRRKDLFRDELLAALVMAQKGILDPATAKGSWAGAMGLTQFMPSEYEALALDMDGDGRRDIWGSVPDALGSAANQLKAKGWIAGLPWGHEVRLPANTSCVLEGLANRKPARAWAQAGITRIDGKPFSDVELAADAFLIKPAGPYGPAFLAFENFLVIKRYNMSDLYVLFVASLADRIGGGGPFQTAWSNLRQLPGRDIEEVQQRLKDRGYDVEKIDGKAGMNTRNQIGAYQKSAGLTLDCWPSGGVLEHLRASATR
jgi:lytic murein transglycosylase